MNNLITDVYTQSYEKMCNMTSDDVWLLTYNGIQKDVTDKTSHIANRIWSEMNEQYRSL